MSELATDLLTSIHRLTHGLTMPRVQQFELPPISDESDSDKAGTRKNNFAAMVLEDGSVGLTYVALDQALKDLRQHPLLDTIQGANPLELAALYRLDAGWQRALGLSAINALSQHAMREKRVLQPMTDTLPVLLADSGDGAGTGLRPTDHIGMVGYFGRVVEPLVEMGAKVTVIELQADLTRTADNLEVTLDTSRLTSCNKVLVTGTTLINHTIDNILKHCPDAENILMLGPTASCIPQPLFDRGLTLIGGFHVTDAASFVASWRAGKSWRQFGFRYSISASDWKCQS